jgi:type II secretory pathway pseudopilin PulG
MKKYLLILSILAILISPNFASAVTIEELQAQIQAQINALLTQLQSLQSQLAQMQGGTTQWCHDFNVNLKIGDRGNEVSLLRAALAKEGFEVFNPQENPYESSFDESLASAVTGFQEKYKDEILTPLGLKYGTGYVGEKTRAKLNSLYGCGVTTTPTTPSITVVSPNGGETLKIGSPYTIQWKTTGNITGMYVVASLIDGPTAGIITGAVSARTSSYVWNVEHVVHGDDVIINIQQGNYKVKIALYDGRPCLGLCPPGGTVQPQIIAQDTSDAPFSIVAAGTPSITVLSPNGGEVWEIGKTYTISWTPNRDDMVISIVDENKNYVMEIVKYTAGPYQWTILPRSVSPGKYYLKISHLALGLEDISDVAFSIVAPGTALPPTYFTPPAGYSSWEEYNKDVSVNKPAIDQKLPQSVADRAWQIVKTVTYDGGAIPASVALQMAAKEAGYAPSPYTPALTYVHIPPGDPPIPQPAVVTITQSDLSRCAPMFAGVPPPAGYSNWLAYNTDVGIVQPAVNFRLPPAVALKAANIIIQQCTGTATIILQQVAKESGYVVSPYSSPTAPFYVYVPPPTTSTTITNQMASVLESAQTILDQISQFLKTR